MPFSEIDAQILRSALKNQANLTEKQMFGGLCFFINGNMLCGLSKQGGMFRVGKENEQEALKLKGVTPFSLTGRKMGGLVQTDQDLLEDEPRLQTLLDLALEFVTPLPAKPNKPRA